MRKEQPNEEQVENILDCWTTATDADRGAGAHWYDSAHAYARGLSDVHKVSVDLAAAVIAVLSPRVSWTLNQVNAEELLATGSCPATFDRSERKCQAILAAGTPEVGYSFGYRLYPTSVNGPKVSRFYRTIREPNTSDCVVIDRHAVDIAVNRKGASEKLNLDTERQYRPYEAAYLEAARRLNIRPHVLQAATWVSWRRRHGIVDSYSDVEDF